MSGPHKVDTLPSNSITDRVVSVRFLLTVLAIVTAGYVSRLDVTSMIDTARAATAIEHRQMITVQEKTQKAIYLETTIRALPQSEQLKLIPWLITTKIDPEDRSAMIARIHRKYLEIQPKIYDWQVEPPKPWPSRTQREAPAKPHELGAP